MESGQGNGTRYRAFLSYNHKDRQQARWLHRRLESYRMPRRLVGREGARGIVPSRLTPIFRDREELPAAGDLSTEVRAALAASESLIVVCSPNAAASPWVAKEVKTFRELHAERPIFATILEGEPEQCFPAGLSTAAIEPLAADLRPEGDGRRLGTLKLVAGIAGVGLDALVQRDAQRRIRRVTAVTLGALMMMLVTSGLAIFAFTARAEAEKQRAGAEGLVEFMLTDLRERLRGVGRLDVLTAVNQRALAYYRAQDLDALSADSLERRARILHAMGEDDEKRGKLLRALALFREASRTTAALLAAAPQDPSRTFAHSQSEYWIGMIAWRANRIPTAETAFRRYRQLAARLVQHDASNPDWLMEAGYAESNLGSLLLRGAGDPERAERSFKAALDYFQKARRLDPRNDSKIWDIADGHAWLADAYRHQRKYALATAERARQAELISLLRRRDPDNARYARGELGNQLGFAQIELDSGSYRVAEHRLARLNAMAIVLAKADPENEDLQKQRIATSLFLAKAILKARDHATHPISTPSVNALLGNCEAPLARGDPEITAFCAILSARARGIRPTKQAEQIQDGVRLSPRWGIDFAAERASYIKGG